MGSGMAANFLKAGYSVAVWNRSADKAAVLVGLGAELAASPREATALADIIFEVTANDKSSQTIWLGDDGILAAATTEKILITSATLTVDWTLQLAQLCAEKGLRFFDMPLTGGRVAAEAGNLTLLAGGDEALLQSLQPDLKAISGKLFYFGPAGAGMKYKLVLNGLQAAHLTAFGEALRLATAAGLPTDKVGPALVDRPGGIVTQIGWEAYQKDTIPLTFSVDWIAKDLDYAKQLAEHLNLPILDGVIARYKQAQADGLGSEDWASINKL